MIRAYRFRLYPTSRQHTALGQMVRDHAEVYNAALQERRDAWKTRQARVTATAQMAQLRDMRISRPDQAVWSFTSQQQTIRRLDKTFAAFFRRVKAGQTPGYPRFRSTARFDTVDFRYGDGIGFTHLRTTRAVTGSKQTLWHTDGLPAPRSRGKREARLRIQGVGVVRVWMHRAIGGRGCVDGGLGHPRRQRLVPGPAHRRRRNPTPVDRAVGGNGLGWTSDGRRLPNPQALRAAHTHLVTAQQALARKKRGSNRRKAQVTKVARLHAKVARVRRDHLHKTAAALVGVYDLIAVEDLQIGNMTRRPKPKPNPDTAGAFLPNKARAKAGLNTSILDAGWGLFTMMLRSKAECAGVEIITVNPANTSRCCNECGHTAKENRNRKRFRCLACGHTGDADINAARNILDRGLAPALSTTGVCPTNGVTGIEGFVPYRVSAAGIRSLNVTAKAFRAGFHLVTHRA